MALSHDVIKSRSSATAVNKYKGSLNNLLVGAAKAATIMKINVSRLKMKQNPEMRQVNASLFIIFVARRLIRRSSTFRPKNTAIHFVLQDVPVSSSFEM